MPRIRTIKPDFYKHQMLNDMEEHYPEHKPMLVFEALWGHCDKQGVFKWDARDLKLDILPFVNYNLAVSLVFLECFGFVSRYEIDDEIYGFVPTFHEHQRITGDEGVKPAKYPISDVFIEPETSPEQWDKLSKCPWFKRVLLARSKARHTNDTLTTQARHTEETVKMTGREGKGREEEEERKGGMGEISADESAGPEKQPRITEPTREPFTHPPELNPTAWAEFDDYRRKGRNKKTWTDLAQRKAAQTLAKFSFDEQQQAVNDSIQSGWPGVYPKTRPNLNGGRSPPAEESIDARVARLERERQQRAEAQLNTIDGECRRA